jgi:hypothetical protein
MSKSFSPFLIPLLAGAVFVGCTDDRTTTAESSGESSAAQPIAAGGEYVEPSSFKPFYAETKVQDKSLHGTIYLFGQRKTWQAYKESGAVNPLKIRSYIGAGPGKETVTIETDKDAPSMTNRVLKQFQARHNLQ